MTSLETQHTPRHVLVTGGAGFIGSNLVYHLLESDPDVQVVNFDKLTYAGNLNNLSGVAEKYGNRYAFVEGDICDEQVVRKALEEFNIDTVIHLAAESHVDRSIDGPAAFMETNIIGTYTLLQCTLEYWRELGSREKDAFRFHHISTDEVYGSLSSEGLFTESTSYDPRSPYSASKASSDHLVRAWHHTYGFPTLITNCSNNYGPYHFPEKLIPLVILNAILDWL